jgi:putative cofactor-binding repeat protein
MSASVWAPGTSIDANNSIKQQAFVATAGQTIFNLTDFTYVNGTGSLYVFVAGGAQRPGVDFFERSTSQFELSTGAPEGAIVLALGFVEVSAILDTLLTYSPQYQVMTAGQTVVNFSTTYVPGVASLAIYYNGIRLAVNVDYTETSVSSITLTNPALVGDTVYSMIGQEIVSTDAVDASVVSYNPAGTGAVATNVQTKLRESVSVQDFGAVGDGVTNDAPAIALAITAVIAAGGGTVFFPAGTYKCATRIGTFVNAADVTLSGYGAEIQNYAGSNVQGLMQFGNAALDGYSMYSASTITVKNLNIFGLKFTSSDVFDGALAGRWSDQMPISINTASNVLIRDCYFENWDFAAIDFGAICRDCLVDACSFYSSEVDAGHANHGVRIFCYANYTNYSNGNGDLSPTSTSTGILKVGYSLISDSAANWGHENISVTNCYFENISHGVMVSSARRGIIANNRFKNLSTRTVSLTTYSQEYLCSNNTHSLNTTQQTSSGVSTFYGLGQASYRHQIQGEYFRIVGGTNSATGFTPIKCYLNSHNWLIAGCKFEIPTWAGTGGRCINVEDNSDGVIRDNHFNTPNVVHPVAILPAYTTASPGFVQQKISVIGNVFESFTNGAMEIYDTTATPEAIVIKDNIIYDSQTRFVATVFSAAGKVAKLFLDGNKFLGSPVRYVDNTTANKAILLHKDILEMETLLSTGGGVGNPSTTAVSFDFSAYSLPACFSNGTKKYLFTAYGGRENAQLSTDFYFSITGETATSISGNIIRNAGASFQFGYVSLKVVFEPFNT